MDRYLVKAYCKVNLHLDITGKRNDGYHDIYTLFQSINLFDEIIANETDQFGIKIDNKNVPLNESNTVVKSYNIFKEHYKGAWQEFAFTLKKNIPIGSGMGGGSADGAAILKFLNEFYGNPFSQRELYTFALQVGADVVFLLRGGTAIGEKLGDKLQFIDNKDIAKLNIIAVYPNIQVSTKWAYDNVKKHLTQNKKTFNINNLKNTDKIFYNTLKTNYNVFEPLIFEFYPRIREIKEKMQQMHPLFTMMTGTGSAVFGLFNEKIMIDDIDKYFGGNAVFTTNLLTRDLIEENFLTSM